MPDDIAQNSAPASSDAAPSTPANTTVSASTETASAAPTPQAATEAATKIEATPTILGSDADPVKTGEEIAPETKVEAEQSAETAPLPTYEAFTLPEDIVADKGALDSFTKDLAEFERTTKADHAEVQKFGQALVDKYVAEMRTAVEQISKNSELQHEQRKTDYLQMFKDDPEIGKNRQQTSITSVRSFIDRFGGTPEQVAEFRGLMANEPVANHPAIMRLLLNADAQLKKYETEQNVRQLTAVPRAPKSLTREKMYK